MAPLRIYSLNPISMVEEDLPHMLIVEKIDEDLLTWL